MVSKRISFKQLKSLARILILSLFFCIIALSSLCLGAWKNKADLDKFDKIRDLTNINLKEDPDRENKNKQALILINGLLPSYLDDYGISNQLIYLKIALQCRLNKFEEALESARYMSKHFPKDMNPTLRRGFLQISNENGTLGTIYLDWKKWDLAFKCFEKNKSFLLETPKPTDMEETDWKAFQRWTKHKYFEDIGDCYLGMGKFSIALSAYSTALDNYILYPFLQENKLRQGFYDNLIHLELPLKIAECYEKLGDKIHAKDSYKQIQTYTDDTAREIRFEKLDPGLIDPFREAKTKVKLKLAE